MDGWMTTSPYVRLHHNFAKIPPKFPICICHTSQAPSQHRDIAISFHAGREGEAADPCFVLQQQKFSFQIKKCSLEKSEPAKYCSFGPSVQSFSSTMLGLYYLEQFRSIIYLFIYLLCFLQLYKSSSQPLRLFGKRLKNRHTSCRSTTKNEWLQVLT